MNAKPRKLIPEAAAKRLLDGDVEMLAAALSHGLDGTEVWPDTHLPVAMGILWHCPDRVEEMLELMHEKGLLAASTMPLQAEAQVAGCWRAHPARIESRLAAMKWLVDKGDPNSGQRMVEASIGAAFPEGVAAFWEYLPKSQHIAALQMALIMDEPETLRVIMERGVDIEDPTARAMALKAARDDNRGREASRIAQLVMRAKTPAAEPGMQNQPRF